MVKKIYNISGFDCPNCAAKAEAHLNKQKEISYAHLDFSANRLYITFENEAYSVEELSNKIAEVESDPLNISEYTGEVKKQSKIFTKKMLWTTIRIAISIALIVVCMTVFHSAKYEWLRFGLYLGAFFFLSYDILWKIVLHIKNKENILDHNLLIAIAAVGAFALSGLQNSKEAVVAEIHEAGMEALMIVILFQIGNIIENVASNKSKSAIMSAVELRVDTANLLTDEGVKKVKPEELKLEDTIIVRTGELIPVDGVVIGGEGYVDTSSLTGEYVPIKAIEDTKVFSGCLLKSGTITVKVEKIYADSTVSKILELIAQGGEKKSKADKFIAKFSKIYTPIIVLLAIVVFITFGLLSTFHVGNIPGWFDIDGALYIGLEILVTGCPCAIVISVPLAYFSGIGLASKHGIVVKGASYLDELVNMGKLVTDKTGTLTHGSFKVTVIKPYGMDKDTLMEYVYAAESLSTHPIGKAICHGLDVKKIASEQKDFAEIAGLGVETHYKGKHIIAGNEKLMAHNHIKHETASEIGSVVYVAVDGEYCGYLVLADELKEDAQPMVDLLHSEKVEIILLTGDHEENAKDICNKLGIDRWHSELLPENKTDYLVEEMKDTKKAMAFIGDGINDAPSIIRSDIGIAMGGIGSDVAVENADIVIMNDDPAKVYDAMKIAKMARNTSIFNIAFALTIKGLIALLTILLPMLNVEFPMFIPVIGDTGLTVLLVLNSLILLYRPVKRKKLK